MGGGVLFVLSLACGIWSYTRLFGAVASAPSAAAPVAIDFALFTVFALHHSFFARRGLRTRIAAALPAGLERSVYVWVASAMFIVVCLLWRAVPGEYWRVGWPESVVLIGLQLSGVWITEVASRQLDVFSLAGIRQVESPVARRPAVLVETGWYRLVRHPIYFGWVLMVWPTPHMTGTRLAFAAISTGYLAAAIPFEERSLRRDFGDDYARYAATVKWRMIPFLY